MNKRSWMKEQRSAIYDGNYRRQHKAITNAFHHCNKLGRFANMLREGDASGRDFHDVIECKMQTMTPHASRQAPQERLKRERRQRIVQCDCPIVMRRRTGLARNKRTSWMTGYGHVASDSSYFTDSRPVTYAFYDCHKPGQFANMLKTFSIEVAP